MLGDVYSQLFCVGSGQVPLGKARRYKVTDFT